jgi:PAS domain S-box-containing protein
MGWRLTEVEGQPLEAVFNVVNQTTRRRVENPASRALREGTVVGLANHSVLLARDGTEHAIDDSAAPIRDRGGNTLGVVLVFRDVTTRKLADGSVTGSKVADGTIDHADMVNGLPCALTMAADHAVTVRHQVRESLARCAVERAGPKYLGRTRDCRSDF